MPQFWLNLLFKPHKNFEERRKVWLFLFHNGIHPMDAAKWTLWHDLAKPLLSPSRRHLLDYDSAAYRSVYDLARKATVNPKAFDKYKVYDMIAGKVI